MTTKRIPIKVNAAPNPNRGAGISWNRAMPRTVAPMGSIRAIVAVSKDFRFDKEEKYKVCAIAVGSIPKPKSGRMNSVVGKAGIL